MKAHSIAALFSACVAAQAPTSTPAMSIVAMPAPSAAETVAAGSAGVIHTVTVGGEMPAAVAGQPAAPVLSFSPDNVIAAPGDIVRFEFMQKNHSVAQSSFDTPCEVIAGGAQSGFMPNPQGTLPPPSFDFQVRDTSPVWMYCQQANHCGQGMVFAVNPANATGQASDKSMANYKQNAISKFGTQLAGAALATTGSVQQAAASQTVTVNVASGGAATGTAPTASASVVGGSGTGSTGETCSCQCLCGVNAFPAGAGVGQFGGFLGEMPTAPSGMAAVRRGLPPPFRVKRTYE